MSDGYGSASRPVPHDPMSRILEVELGSRSDLIIIRSGFDLPTGTLNGRNVVFSRTQPSKDETKSLTIQPDAHLDGFYCGVFTDATNINPDPPDGFNYLDDPFRTTVPERQITASTVPNGFPLRAPSPTEWRDRSNNYVGGVYLWATGWAPGFLPTSTPPIQCCLVNTRKIRADFKRLGNPSAPPGSPARRSVEIDTMSITVFYQATFPAQPGAVLMCEFASYKYTTPTTSGDFFTTTKGAVYANEVRLLRRGVCRVDTSVLLPAVIWSYNLKKEITVSGGTMMTEAEMQAFTNQPGG